MHAFRELSQWLASDATSARTVRAVTLGLLFAVLLLCFMPAVKSTKDLWRLPWASIPGLTAAMALVLAFIWPSMTRLAFTPGMRRWPRRSDVLAHAGLCLAGGAAAWMLWGRADILPVCALGAALGLAPHGAQALQMAWGLPLTCLGGNPAGRPEERLAQTPGNVVRAGISAALAPLDEVYFLLAISVTARPEAAILPSGDLLELFFSRLVKYAVALHLVIFIFRLGSALRWSLTPMRPILIATVYGLAVAGCALLLLFVMDAPEGGGSAAPEMTGGGGKVPETPRGKPS